MTSPRTILAVSGSLRAESSNTSLLKAAAELAPTGFEVVLFQGMGSLPHFNPDREFETQAPVQAWTQALKSSAALLFSTPEYAHGIPGTLKNALDWVVGSGELMDKPVGILDTSPAGNSLAHASLVETLKVMSAKVVPQAVVHIANLRTKIDDQGKLTDAAAAEGVREALKALAADI